VGDYSLRIAYLWHDIGLVRVDIVPLARFRFSCSRGDIELLLEPEVDRLG
jgi:hypothetical protein